MAVSGQYGTVWDQAVRVARAVEWSRTPTAAAVAAILAERGRYPELARALYDRVFEVRGGRFTLTVLRHYADRGRFDAGLLTPVVADIGEALVFRYALDVGEMPDEARLAAIVDEAILPAIGLGSRHPPGVRGLARGEGRRAKLGQRAGF